MSKSVVILYYKKMSVLTRGYAIYNFGKNPFLFITISKDNLSDVCPGVEKKSRKEIVHFHYTTKMAT